MCGRYVQSKSWRDYQRYLRAVKILGAIEDRPSWNVAPSTSSLTVFQDGGGMVMSRMRWGLAGLSGLIANARMETAAERPAFRDAWRHSRGVVPVDGWYEWRTQSGLKQPFYFTQSRGEPIMLAALIKDGSYTLMTAETSGPLREIHTRRPVAISIRDADAWCDPTAVWSADDLADALVGEDAFNKIPVGPAVNSSRNDGPQLIEQVEVPKSGESQLSLGF